jgi:hypothetical protein
MTKKILLVITFSLIVVLGGCSIINFKTAKTAAPPSKYDFSAIKNPQKTEHRNLSIYKPGDWQEIKKDLTLYFLPPGATVADSAAEKITVAVYSLPAKSTTTLANLMKADIAENKKTMPGLKFVYGTEDVKLGPLAAREEKYEVALAGKNINITQIEARSDGLLYKIQHYCVKDNCQADEIFSEMAGSFEPVSASSLKK